MAVKLGNAGYDFAFPKKVRVDGQRGYYDADNLTTEYAMKYDTLWGSSFIKYSV